MKGILLAGGLGTRLYPTTRIVNKHLLPLYDRPMFFWPLQSLIDSGIKQIAIVSGPPLGHQVKAALEHFPKGKNIKLIFMSQPKPLGIPHAALICKKFLGRDSFALCVGDNIYSTNFKNEIEGFGHGATAFIKKVSNPSDFGVVKFSKSKKIVDIVEKPKKYISSWAVGAPYLFDNTALVKIENLKPSKRGELEVVDLLKKYIDEGNLRLLKRKGSWLDAGTPDSLLRASIIAKKMAKSF